MKRAARRRPASRLARQLGAAREEPPKGGCDRRGIARVQQLGVGARDLAQDGQVRARDEHPTRHGLEDRKPEALVERRGHEHVGLGVQGLQVVRRHRAEHAHVLGEAQLVHQARQLARVRSEAREDEHGALVRRQLSQTARQDREVLVRDVGRDRQRDRATVGTQPLACAGDRGLGHLGRRRDPMRDDGDELALQVELGDDVVASGVGAGDDPVRAARRGRDGRFGPPPQRGGHGAGQAPEDQVVEGHYAREGAVQGREVRRAVQHLDLLARRRPRQHDELTERPPAPVQGRRAAQHDHVVGEIPPEAMADGRRLAVDERGDAQIVALLADGGGQLAGVRLATARSTGNEEEEVEPEVHRYPRAAWTARQYQRCSASTPGTPAAASR